MQFRVHLYPTIRYDFEIVAGSAEEAVKIAERKFLADDRQHVRGIGEYAEEIRTALVDFLDHSGERISSTEINLAGPSEKAVSIELLENLVADLRKRNDDLVACNNAYLARARAAEQALRKDAA